MKPLGFVPEIIKKQKKKKTNENNMWKPYDLFSYSNVYEMKMKTK